jgi:hypothetical protein
MAKGSGGTRGASGGGSGRSSGGGSTGAPFGEGGRGLFINGIEQESEKALKINTDVSWNANRPKATSLWIPKSAIAGKGNAVKISGKNGEKSSQQYINVKDWFVESLKSKVYFKGYQGVLNPNMGDLSW